MQHTLNLKAWNRMSSTPQCTLHICCQFAHFSRRKTVYSAQNVKNETNASCAYFVNENPWLYEIDNRVHNIVFSFVLFTWDSNYFSEWHDLLAPKLSMMHRKEYQNTEGKILIYVSCTCILMWMLIKIVFAFAQIAYRIFVFIRTLNWMICMFVNHGP